MFEEGSFLVSDDVPIPKVPEVQLERLWLWV